MPASHDRPADSRAAVRALLAAACVAVGCQASGDPALPLREVVVWSLPPEGRGLPAPRGMTIGPDGSLYVLDTVGRVLVYDAEGELVRQWRMPDATVGRPEGICVLIDGRIAVADTHYQRVVFFDAEGTVVGMFGSHGREAGQFIYPTDVIQDPSGNLYVAEYGGNDRIQKFTSDGVFLKQFGGQGTGPGQFDRPTGLVWHDGAIYVSDATNGRVHVFADDGRFDRVLDPPGGSGGRLQYPYGLALDPQSHLWLIEFGAGRITRQSREGAILGRYGSVGHGSGQFSSPWGIAVDQRGRVFVGDTGNRRIVALELP